MSELFDAMKSAAWEGTKGGAAHSFNSFREDAYNQGVLDGSELNASHVVSDLYYLVGQTVERRRRKILEESFPNGASEDAKVEMRALDITMDIVKKVLTDYAGPLDEAFQRARNDDIEHLKRNKEDEE